MQSNSAQQTLESLQALSAILVEAPAFLISIINDKLPEGNNGRHLQAVINDTIDLVQEMVTINDHLQRVLDSHPDGTV